MRAVLAPHDLTHVQFVLLASLWWLTDHGDGPRAQARLGPANARCSSVRSPR